jgi:outer membrane protein assembly factor BamB
MVTTPPRKYLAALVVAVLILAGTLSFLAWRHWRKHPVPRVLITRTMPYDAAAPFRTPAEDWPQWLGPRGDGISREAALAPWPDSGPRCLWSADVGLGYASPVAVAGQIYLFTFDNGTETLTAFDARSGKTIWSDSAKGGWSGSQPGTRATPVIHGQHIYTFGGAGDLICRNLSTGNPLWHINVLASTGSANLQWGAASPPLLDNGLIFVQCGKGGPTCVAVEEGSGAIAWHSQARTQAGYAHPILADVGGTRQLIVLAGDALYGMDPLTGRTLWSEPWATTAQANCSPPVYADGHLFITSAEGHGSLMLRLSPTGATHEWASKALQGYFQSPIRDSGYLYLNSNGNMTCVKFPDGQVAWSAPDASLHLNFGGSIVRVGDQALLLSAHGKLSLVRATPQGVALLAQAQVLDGTETFATPLLYAGRLYLKGTRQLICLEMATAHQ